MIKILIVIYTLSVIICLFATAERIFTFKAKSIPLNNKETIDDLKLSFVPIINTMYIIVLINTLINEILKIIKNERINKRTNRGIR